MTALKQKAVDLIERMSDEKIQYVIQIIEGVDGLFPNENKDKKREAYNDLMSLIESIEPVEPFDYDQALEEYRKEKYGL
ncbi:MAG: hypothetical protein IKS17_04775 [Firmicutes bacterium]|nr:hypothetical protein [Bacillota bacterium]